MTTIADPKVGVTYRTVLLKAAEVVRQRGHEAKGAFGPNGEVCVFAALGYARGVLGVAFHARIHGETVEAIQKVIGGECPIDWNTRQNAASVIAMFERAAFQR